MKQPRPPHHSGELARAAGISKRQLTRWFAHGVLGPPPRRGPNVGYTEEQILRARAASALRREGARLDEIRQRLDDATPADLERWASGDLGPASPAGATSYPAARCEHVEVAPGLTLVVRDDCDPAVRRMAQEIYARYGPARR